jgi:putative ABC transport system ATP-binding protein
MTTPEQPPAVEGAVPGAAPPATDGVELAVAARDVAHAYGSGELRRRVLFDIDVDVRPGEVVLLTGPSGSGKTTLLTLVGALRSLQQGSLRVLGRELAGASAAARALVRRGIGFVFQAHNLLDAMSARENVLLSLELHEELDGAERLSRADAMLAAVGLADYAATRPGQLSGGQRQRVAVARALAAGPRLVLADEPTASLDGATGHAVAELLERVAREQGVAVLMVTHDHRILDVADRVVHLEDGRLVPAAAAVAAGAQRLMASLARTYDSGRLMGELAVMPEARVETFLDELTAEANSFLAAVRLAESSAVESMLRQVLEGLTRRIGGLLDAERATLFLADPPRRLLWSLYADVDGSHPVRLRVRYGQGIAGTVAATGLPRNARDAYADPLFDRSIDARTGFRTRSVLAVPIHDAQGGLIGVAQVLNKEGPAAGEGFDEADVARFTELGERLGPILESWRRLAERRTGAEAGGDMVASRPPG